jgi:hypothetical protein
MPDPHLRAGDDDREAVAAALGAHMAAGRLTLAEYEERLVRAYAARTFGELAELTADLPAPAPVPARPAADAATAADGTPPVVRPAPSASGPAGLPGHVAPWAGHGHDDHSWRSWLATSAIVLAVYLAVSLSNGQFDYFWPMWVIGPWGAVLLASRLGGAARGSGERPPR